MYKNIIKDKMKFARNKGQSKKGIYHFGNMRLQNIQMIFLVSCKKQGRLTYMKDLNKARSYKRNNAIMNVILLKHLPETNSFHVISHNIKI